MGADMIVSTLWLPVGVEPDWEAAEKAAAEFTCSAEGFPIDSDLHGSLIEQVLLGDFEHHEAKTDKARKEIVDGLIGGALKVVKAGVNGKRRDLTWSQFAGWTVYITGGLSWGDSPTDCCEAITSLQDTGILEEAGFFRKPRKVVAVTIESEYAHTISLVPDEATAEKEVASFCRDFWSKIVADNDPSIPPENDADVIEEFFNHAPSGWWEKRQVVSTDQVAI